MEEKKEDKRRERKGKENEKKRETRKTSSLACITQRVDCNHIELG
jgi:hypothetical protein